MRSQEGSDVSLEQTRMRPEEAVRDQVELGGCVMTASVYDHQGAECGNSHEASERQSGSGDEAEHHSVVGTAEDGVESGWCAG